MDKCILMSVCGSDCPQRFKKCMKSLLLDDKSIDLFLSVDGEISEGLEEVLKPYTLFTNVFIVRGKDNIGLTKRLNQLVDLSLASSRKYELFFRMDADDLCINERFRKQEYFLSANPTIDVCASSSLDFWTSGQVTSRTLPKLHKDISKAILTRNPIKHSTVCFRRHLFELGFRYDERFLRCQDRVMWVDLISSGYQFHILTEPLIEYENDLNFIRRKKDWNAIKFTIWAQIYTLFKLRPVTVFPYLYFMGLIISKMLPARFLRLLYMLAEK